MSRLPPRSTRTDTLFPYSTLFRSKAQIVLNGTGFALSAPGAARAETPFDVCDGPVLQVVFSGGTAAAWQEGTSGLSARDIALNVALPEVDGRVITRAVSFKGAARYDAATQRSEEHTSELQPLMRTSSAVF